MRLDLTEYELAGQDNNGAGTVPEALALAVLAAENYCRDRRRRGLELIYAKLYLRLTGRLPSMSLGAGQLKPESARRAFGRLSPDSDPRLSDLRLLQLLSGPESNYRLVRLYLEALFEDTGRGKWDDAAATELVQRYNGQRTVNANGDSYTGLVHEIWKRLEERRSQGEPPR